MATRHRLAAGVALAGIGLILTLPIAAALNGFNLWWHVVPGGGGSSSGGGFAVHGGVGQPIVGSSSGGGFGVTGGFWTVGGAGPPGPTATLPPGPTATLPPGPTPTLPEPTCANVLPGGDFEGPLEPPWGASGAAQRTTDQAHSGAHSARVAGGDNAFGELGTGMELPSGTGTITLSLWWYLESSDPHPDADRLTVIVGGPGGEAPVLSLTNLSPRGSWHKHTVDLSGRAGQPVGIIFVAETNGDGPSSFFVDDVELRVCGGVVPPAGPERAFLPVVLKRAWR